MDFLMLCAVNSFDEVCEKMQKKIVISMVVVTLLLMGIMATSVLASDLTLSKTTTVAKMQQSAAETQIAKIDSARELSSVAVNADESSVSILPYEREELSNDAVDGLRDAVPDNYEEANARVSNRRTRFLLYTNDGKHIMWGYVGNGHFVGTDNLGKRCWGIYGKGIFAGFYDGEFFWGKYRCGNWKAEGLFGLNSAQGKYILFPTPDITPAITATTP